MVVDWGNKKEVCWLAFSFLVAILFLTILFGNLIIVTGDFSIAKLVAVLLVGAIIIFLIAFRIDYYDYQISKR